MYDHPPIGVAVLMLHLYTSPENVKKNKGFLTFSGEIEIEHSAKMSQ